MAERARAASIPDATGQVANEVKPGCRPGVISSDTFLHRMNLKLMA